ncbi:MAG: MBOAT family protein, partial [Clostridia bacterium]|nr:MBOAT family protein [Clostridia bacterium]
MVFSSTIFLCFFLPIVLALYYLLPNHTLKNWTLLIASLFFYAWGEPIYVMLMLVSVLANYFFGLGI